MNKQKIVILAMLAILLVSPLAVSAKTVDAGIKPGSFFYIFDKAFEKIGYFFTFSSEKKAQKALDHAEERLAEMEAVAGTDDSGEVEGVLKDYDESVARANEEAKGIKDEIKEAKLLSLIGENYERHKSVLEKVLEKVPEQAKESIQKVIEKSLEKYEEALDKIEDLKKENKKLKEEIEKLKRTKDEIKDNEKKESKEIKEDKEKEEEHKDENDGEDDEIKETEQHSDDEKDSEEDGDKEDITNWKTYRNEEYGFEVRYPEMWILSDTTNINNIMPSIELKPTNQGHGVLVTFGVSSPKLDFAGLPKANRTGAEVTFNQNKLRIENCDDKIIVGNVDFCTENFSCFEGHKSKKYSSINQSKDLAVDIFFSSSGGDFNKCYSEDDVKNERIDFNQILSTFKFIDSNSVSEQDQETEKQIGYIKSIYTKNGKKYMDIDYVQWLTGEEARSAMKEDGECTGGNDCAPGGFYVRNQNLQLRTLEVRRKVEIKMVTQRNEEGDEKLSWSEFQKVIEDDSLPHYRTLIPFRVEIESGVIKKIEEQYIP